VLARSEFSAGCAVLAVTVSADVPELVDRAAEIFRSWREHLGQVLESAGIEAARARALALTIIAACEGATVLCRAEHSLEPLDVVAAQLRSLVADARP
jgi:TetR/AcrR family transcriptional repressor of lmrAB and yxaGH operons